MNDPVLFNGVSTPPEEDFTDFPNYIPDYFVAPTPCDYCRIRRLECKVTKASNEAKACLSCNALFRTCSFVDSPNRNKKSMYGTLDTLDVVTEDQTCNSGALTSKRHLFSAGASLDEIMKDVSERHPDKASGRFSKKVLYVMKQWLDDHQGHPYPNDEEKEALSGQTGLTKSQISNWMANARRRGKVRTSKCPTSMSAQQVSTTKPMDIPQTSKSTEVGKDQSHLTPFERWKESPPDHEPASVSAIMEAVKTTELQPADRSGNSTRTPSLAENPHRSSTGGSALSQFRASSSTSLETGRSSGSIGSGSRGSSRGSWNSLAKKDRRRSHRRRATPVPSPSARRPWQPREISANGAARPFQCTFCTVSYLPVLGQASRILMVFAGRFQNEI